LKAEWKWRAAACWLVRGEFVVSRTGGAHDARASGASREM
jgi:hypothetical protein